MAWPKPTDDNKSKSGKAGGKDKADRRGLLSHGKAEENHWLFGGDRRAAQADRLQREHGSGIAWVLGGASLAIGRRGKFDDGKGKKK